MKNFSSMHILTVVTLALFCSLNSMERAPEPPIVQVRSEVPQKISIIYKYANEPIAPQQELVIGDKLELKNLEQLSLLNALPYGAARGWASMPALTWGYYKPTNLVVDVKEASKKLGQKSVILIVQPGGSLVKSMAPEGRIGSLLSRAAEEIAPYTHTIQPYQKQTEQPFTYKAIWEDFAQVQSAFLKGEKIEERYWLKVGKNATPQDIYKAYLLAKSQYEPYLQKTSRDEREYGQDILNFLRLAYESLRQVPNAKQNYEEAIKKYYGVPPYTQENQPPLHTYLFTSK